MTAPTKAKLTPAEWFTDTLTAMGSKRWGKKWQCPGHGLTGEHSVSLVIDDGRDGGVVLFCHAGCGWRDILRALKLSPAVLTVPPPTPPARHANTVLRGVKFPPPKTFGSSAERGFMFETEHPYGEPEPFAWKVRLRHPSGAKEVTWESLNPRGERGPGLMGRRQVDLPLYRERDIRMAIAAEETVIVCESESSVDALTRAGWYATTWPGGAADPPVQHIRALLGSYDRALLIPDNDAAGINCADKLTGAAAIRKVLIGNPDEDARDLLARVGPDAFRVMVEEATR